MPTQFITSFLFSLLSFACFAQSNVNVDSVRFITEDKSFPDTVRIESCYFLANYYVSYNPDSAEFFALKGLDKSEEIQFVDGMGQGYGWMGYLNADKGNIITAIDYNLKSLKIVQELGYESEYPVILNNLGMLHTDLKNYDQALSYFDECLEINFSLDRMSSAATNYNNIGLIYKNQEKFSEAIDMYQKSLEIRLDLADEKGIGFSYSNLGTIYEQLDSFDLAMSYYKKALTCRENQKVSKGLALSYSKLANIMAKMNDNLSKALLYAHKAYDISEKFNYKYEKKEAAKVLASIYKKHGDYKRGLMYHEIYTVLHDEIHSIENQKAILQSKYQFEYDQKHLIDSLEKSKVLMENELLVQENKVNESRLSIQRLWLTISCLGLVFLIIVLIFIRKNGQIRMEKLRAQIRFRLSETIALKNELLAEKQKGNNQSLPEIDLNLVLNDKLTGREQEILDALVLGLSNKEIGEKLFLSVNTIKTHILSLYAKLDVNNRTQAAVKGSLLQIQKKK